MGCPGSIGGGIGGNCPIQGAGSSGGNAASIGSAIVLAAAISEARNNKAERDKAHKTYKDFQLKGYQRDDDPCKNLKNRIDFIDKMVKYRTDYDTRFPHPKYPNGRHAVVIARDTADLKRLKERYKRDCQNMCIG